MVCDLRDAGTVLDDVVAPARVVVSDAGVFVVLAKEDGSRADLREQVRAVRDLFDAAGLSALSVEGVLCVPYAGETVRPSRGVLIGDLEGIVRLVQSDVRLGARIHDHAVAALAPGTALTPTPPWVATVAASGPQPDLDPAVARPARRRLVARDGR